MNLTQNDFAKLNAVDCELLYIATESASAMFIEKKTVKTWDLLNEIGKSVGQLLIERNSNTKWTMKPAEFVLLAREVGFSSSSHEVPEKRTVEELAELVAQASIHYAALRQLGMPSILKESNPQNDYWPFGQEGGFCNPVKLKMMDD